MEDYDFKRKWYAGETIWWASAKAQWPPLRFNGARRRRRYQRGCWFALTSRFPTSFRPASNSCGYTDKTNIGLDEENWMTITDALAQVVSPMGTAPSARLPGIDFAGKTGSAQTISNDLRASPGRREAL